jgi:putative ABC transport system permease protein
MNDLRFALRVLIRNRSLTGVAVCSLALGIGANTAIFSIVNAVLLRPLPFQDPRRLMLVETTGDFGDAMSGGDFRDLRGQATSLSCVTAYATGTMNLSGDTEAERIATARVSANFCDLLGVQPRLGRTFTLPEDQAGAEKVVLLSHSLWQRRFGGDRSILGHVLRLDGRNCVVIGVMPPGFEFPEKAEAWIPLGLGAPDLNDYGSYFLRILTRVRHDANLAQVGAELELIGQRARGQYPEFRKSWKLRLTSLHEYLVGSTRKMVFVLFGAVALVLLIACANVANLLLAHAADRRKEMAVRLVLGAGPGRLARQLLTESMLLAAVGGILGVLLAVCSMPLVNSLLPASIPHIGQISIDARVLCFTVGILVLAGLIFGLAPALQASAFSLNDSLKQGARGVTGGIGAGRLRATFIVSELSLAVILLVGAGLFLKSLLILQHVSPGFQAEQVLTARIELSETRYAKPAQLSGFERAVLERVQALPSVRSAAVISRLPFSGGNIGYGIDIEGRQTPSPNIGKGMQGAGFRSVSPDYFATMQIAHLAGRMLTERDDEHAQPVALINEQMAKTFWPGQNPVGRRFRPTFAGGAWTEIVGVVSDVRHASLDKPPDPEVYVPFAQNPASQLNLAIRTAQDPVSQAAAIRAVINSVDPDQAVYNLRPMEELIFESVGQPRFRTWLIGAFAIIAMALTAIGIYGVMSYAVAQRTREIGVRMALGAQLSDVIAAVGRQGLRLTLLGLAIGFVGALAFTRILKSLLYQVAPTDLTTFITVAILVLCVAIVATWGPARRAAQVDPMEALRYE